MADPTVFVVTLKAVEAAGQPSLTVLAFARADDEDAAGKVATAELEGLGWSGIEIERAGEVTNPDALPDDFRDAMATALTWGCGLIIYDEP
ncbi:MAG: hypothetical protein AB1942_02555 [Pseudomonadota bacterium]